MSTFKSIFCLLILFSITVSGQTFDYVIEYDYNYQPNASDSNSVENERMLLLYNTKKSHFISKSKFTLDSIKEYYGNDLQKLLAFKKTIPKNRVKYEIIKNFDNSSNSIYYEKIVLSTYKNTFKNDLDYKLVTGDSIIAGYNCKKATVELSGRNYTIWYAGEISISDGPYKFKGLPGLVLEAYDDKKHHHFRIAKIEQKEFIYTPNYRNVIEASMEDIAKARSNQLQGIKNAGFNVSPEILRMAKEKLDTYNNPIELVN